MPRPFFSIILPTYNRARLLPRALASVLAQTESSWDLVIVDDGSTDDTSALLATYSTRDARIRMLAQDHQGAARARSVGIAAAEGAYVTFLDSDDEYAPGHLAVRRAFLDAHPDVELLHGGITVSGNPFVADNLDPTRMIPIADCVVGGTFVVRRDLFSRFPWPRIPYSDDGEFYAVITACHAVIATIDTPTYVYHRGEEDSLCVIAEESGIEGVKRFQAIA